MPGSASPRWPFRTSRRPAVMQEARRIVVCVDDFGLDPHVNTGALVLADLGRVSAIGCMVGAPFWHADAAALRRTNAQALDVGVHLDLTQHPLDAGIRRPLWRWIAACHAGAVD